MRLHDHKLFSHWAVAPVVAGLYLEELAADRYAHLLRLRRAGAGPHAAAGRHRWRRLTQAAAAEVVQIDQPRISALVRGRLAGFSLDRRVRFLVLLGSNVDTVVKPCFRATGRTRVMAA
jgi:hypothetical protein